MAASQVSLGYASGTKVYSETDLAEVKSGVADAAGTIDMIQVDNRANTGAATFLKLWDAASGSVTVGTTAPDWIFKIAAGANPTIAIPGGMAFGTALTAACLTAGGTAGTTGPTSDVPVKIVYH